MDSPLWVGSSREVSSRKSGNQHHYWFTTINAMDGLILVRNAACHLVSLIVIRSFAAPMSLTERHSMGESIAVLQGNRLPLKGDDTIE